MRYSHSTVTNGDGRAFVLLPPGQPRLEGIHPSKLDPDNEARKQAIYGRVWENCPCNVYSWINDGGELRCILCGGDLT